MFFPSNNPREWSPPQVGGYSLMRPSQVCAVPEGMHMVFSRFGQKGSIDFGHFVLKQGVIFEVQS